MENRLTLTMPVKGKGSRRVVVGTGIQLVEEFGQLILRPVPQPVVDTERIRDQGRIFGFYCGALFMLIVWGCVTWL